LEAGIAPPSVLPDTTDIHLKAEQNMVDKLWAQEEADIAKSAVECSQQTTENQVQLMSQNFRDQVVRECFCYCFRVAIQQKAYYTEEFYCFQYRYFCMFKVNMNQQGALTEEKKNELLREQAEDEEKIK